MFSWQFEILKRFNNHKCGCFAKRNSENNFRGVRIEVWDMLLLDILTRFQIKK